MSECSEYKVYLTTSVEVAGLIMDAFMNQMSKGNIVGVGHGSADRNDLVPDKYKGCGFFCAYVELKASNEKSKYTLIFA